MSTLSVGTIQSNTSSPPAIQNSSGTEIGTFCRAWANFNGTLTSPITPRASFNVGQVTKSSTGIYVVNFTNSLTDANYAVSGGASTAGANYSGIIPTTYASGSITIEVRNGGGTLADRDLIGVSVFR